MSITQFTVESGIPIPALKRKGRQTSSLTLALRELQVGQSVFVPGVKRVPVFSLVKGSKGQFTTRKAKVGAATGVRVWRVSCTTLAQAAE